MAFLFTIDQGAGDDVAELGREADLLVVAFWGRLDDVGEAHVVDHALEPLDVVGVVLGHRHENVVAPDENSLVGAAKAFLFAAGHRVAHDEVDVVSENRQHLVDENLLDAGNVGDHRAGLEVPHVGFKEIHRGARVQTEIDEVRLGEQARSAGFVVFPLVDDAAVEGFLEDFAVGIDGADPVRPFLSQGHGQCPAHEPESDDDDVLILKYLFDFHCTPLFSIRFQFLLFSFICSSYSDT